MKRTFFLVLTVLCLYVAAKNGCGVETAGVLIFGKIWLTSPVKQYRVEFFLPGNPARVRLSLFS